MGKKELSIDINSLINTESPEQLFKRRLKGSYLLCKTYLIIVYLIIEEGKRLIKLKDISPMVGISKDHCRKYLDLMLDHNVLRSNVERGLARGRTKRYTLNRDEDYYKQFIPIAKEICKYG